MTTLVITEKNKAAEAIANALGTVKTLKITKSLNVYIISSKDIYVIPLRGHLLEYRNTENYKSWSNPPPREIITNPNSIKKIR